MARIVYITPSLYIAGGVERVLTTKANYLADVLGHDVTIVLTDGVGRKPYYPLSSQVKVINLDIGFEDLWGMSFLRKIPAYLVRQWRYRRSLARTLCGMRPDITISLGRREVNFLCDIHDGSSKLCEIHVNRAHYRNFEGADANWFKNIFSRLWMCGLVRQLKRFDKVVCLTPTDAAAWNELDNVVAIPNPLPSSGAPLSDCSNKRVIAVGRYAYQKGFDLLLSAWKKVSAHHPDWYLDIYGSGNREHYQLQCEQLGLGACCHLHDAVPDIYVKYSASSILAVSSRFEGFGMMIVEAMQCGVPPVSFNCLYGPRDIITDGKDGVLVDDGNVDALADGLCMMIEDDAARKRMGRAAVETARRFNIDNVMKRWIEIFDQMLHRRR